MKVSIPIGLTCLLLLPAAGVRAQDAILLAEKFNPGQVSKVEVAVKLSGKLAVPTEKGKPSQLVPMTGNSRVVYEERVLAPDEPGMLKVVRAYRDVTFIRAMGNTTQDAGIRPSVRRMVVIKTDGRRAPFSPDGPLTWGEIDVVRTDVFHPATIPGLLPAGKVRKGQTWKATPEAIAELTDLEKVESGEIAVELVAVTEIEMKRVARLRLSGTVKGVNEDGPNSQTLDGTAYFDLDAGFLTYLSIKGTHRLLDGAGQTVGVIEGQFTVNRVPLAKSPADLSDASLNGLTLKPNPENTLLLYDNEQLGIRFLYPRGWRVGVVQGKQVTLDHARGSGMLITVEPASRVPSSDTYLKEIGEYLTKEKATTAAIDRPVRVRTEPVQLDRFGLDASFGMNKARLEYAILKQTDGGATVAARLPDAEAAAMKPEVERIVRSLSITRKIPEK